MDKQENKYDFRIDIRGMIKLLAKNLYPEDDIFVREMLQNAHDSIQKRKVDDKDKSVEGHIQVTVIPTSRKIIFEDNGRGMTEAEIHDYLSTIGKSGTDEFRQKLLEMGRKAEVSLIGQFGIGLLSCFVVAEEVQVVTCSSLPNQTAWKWISNGDKDYTLVKTEYARIGTTVTLVLAQGKGDAFLEEENLRKTIRKYADFLPFPIYLNADEVPTNTITPPWARTFDTQVDRDFEYYNFVNARFLDAILHVIPIKVTDSHDVEGILYVSDRRTYDFETGGPIDIYQNRVFVESKTREILPQWATFIGGVIDSSTLTLTAARDRVVQDSTFQRVRKLLSDLIINALLQMKVEDPEKLSRLLRWHGTQIKGMSIAHEDFFKAICDLVPFETNRGSMDLKTYFQQSNIAITEGDRVLYFTEAGSATQYYMLCDEKGLLVLNASFLFEEKFLQKYAKLHPNIKLHQINIAGSEFIFSPLAGDERSRFQSLQFEFGRLLGDTRSKVHVVRFQPSSIPAVAMLSSDAKIYKDLEEAKDNVKMSDNVRNLVSRVLEDIPTLPIVLYVNADNPIINHLIDMDLRSEVAIISMTAMLSNAIFLVSGHISKKDAQVMFHNFSRVIEMLTMQNADLENARSRLSTAQLAIDELRNANTTTQPTPYVSCFIAMPFNEEFESIFNALRLVLEDRPYYWQLIRADEKQFEPTISGNVHQHIARAHLYFADITESNFNVGLELGWMQAYPSNPIILLRRDDANYFPADIQGAIYISYPTSKTHSQDELVDFLRKELGRIDALKNIKGSQHYLSPLLLSQSGIDSRLAEAISNWFSSIEEFLSADPKTVAEKLYKGQYHLIASVQMYVRDSLG